VSSQLLVFEGLGGGIRDRGIKGQGTVGDDHLTARKHDGLGVGVAGGDRMQQNGRGNLGPLDACGRGGGENA